MTVAGSRSFEIRNMLSSWVTFSSTNGWSLSSHNARALVVGIKRPTVIIAALKPRSQRRARPCARRRNVIGASSRGATWSHKNADAKCAIGNRARQVGILTWFRAEDPVARSGVPGATLPQPAKVSVNQVLVACVPLRPITTTYGDAQWHPDLAILLRRWPSCQAPEQTS